MPGSSMYRRPLSRSSAHRQALLRNLTTTLIQNETLSTTYAKAKELQPHIEKLITLGKRNTPSTFEKAKQFVFQPDMHLSKVFGTLKERYATRPGGYTRVLRQEPVKTDMAASAMICLVDGPGDVRFNVTARALLRQQEEGLRMNEVTATNVRKVTRFRTDGVEALAREVEKVKGEREKRVEVEKKEFEEKGTVWKFTTELKRADPRWREKRGPGRVVRRKIEKGEQEDLDHGPTY